MRSDTRGSKLISDRDMRQSMGRLEDEGFVVRKLNGGHFVLEHEGVRVATFSGTRVDFHARRNVEATVRRWKREQQQRAASAGGGCDAG